MDDLGQALVTAYCFVFVFMGGGMCGYLLSSRNVVVSFAGIIGAAIIALTLNFCRAHPSDGVPQAMWLMVAAGIALVIGLGAAWFRPLNVPKDF